MIDNLKIRTKLILLLAGPVAIILALGTIGVTSRRDAAAKSKATVDRIELARASAGLLNALQVENLYSTAWVASGRTEWKAQLQKARNATDQALGDAQAHLSAMLATAGPQTQPSLRLAIDAIGRFPYQRRAVDQSNTWPQAQQSLVGTQQTFLAINGRIADELDDPQAASELRAAAALGSYKAAIAQQGAITVGAARSGKAPDSDTLATLQGAVAVQGQQDAVFRSLASVERKDDLRHALSTEDGADLEAARDSVLKAGEGKPVSLAADQVVKWSINVVGRVNGLEAEIDDHLIGTASHNQAASQQASNLFALATLVGVVLAMAAAVVLGRRITKPLDDLTRAAERLSDEQMPKLVDALRNPTEEDVAYLVSSLSPIELERTDEIGQVADAFNKVQQVAGQVATEQASLLRKGIGDMFVNLARRNQGLLDRQIEFIDELEGRETDPDQLENLFRLDHLATRMRRNAESLLVLAGAEPARKRGRPVPLADVVRAALAEVEEFGRIELLQFDEVLIASNAAMDVAHLLSELMENATNFSPPETRVEVVGHRTKADGYVISITDHGIGMSGAQIADANELLARPPLVGLAMSRSLGFIVIGRLAARFGVAVRLMPSASGGVTAVVSLPPALTTDASGLPPAEPRRALQAVETTPDPTPAAPAADSLPPLEFTPYSSEPEPSSLEEAMPTGAAFDAGLASLMGRDEDDRGLDLGRPEVAPTGPHAAPTTPTHTASGLPSRNGHSAAPTVDGPAPLFGGARLDGPAPSVLPTREPAPAPVEAREDGPLSMPMPSAPSPTVEPDPEPKARAAEPAEATVPDFLAPKPVHEVPSFLAPPPSAAPPAPAAKAPPVTATLPVEEPSRPFFLHEGADPPPVRLFGGTDREPEEAVTPAAPEPAAEAPAEAEPGVADLLNPAGRSAPAAGEASGPDARSRDGAVETTKSGLVKRKPRTAVDRPIPGAEVERGAGASRRSPDEVRSLLSNYRAGTARGRTEELAPAGPSEEREP